MAHLQNQTLESAMPQASRIGRYAVLRPIGQGGMGVVLAAYDEELDRKVAVKLLHDSGAQAAEHRIRILREAQAMARVSHPNVVQIYEVGESGTSGDSNGHIFIAMEFIDGTTLLDWQKQPGRTWDAILQIYIAAGQGLLAAHQSGLVHRDFKPDNVLVGADGRARVADFGLARGDDGAMAQVLSKQDSAEQHNKSRSESGLLSSPLTQAGAITGTPMYMSPEQYDGQPIGPRSDQFSFCVALYEALYGIPPFEGQNIAKLAANVLSGRLRPRPAGSQVPSIVHSAISRGLATDPQQRFSSMAELLAALAFNPTESPAALPLSRRVFSASIIAIAMVLTAVFLGPTLRKQNTVRMALISAVVLFLGIGLLTLFMRKTLLRNAFHRGMVFLMLSLSAQEALISLIAYLTGMSVAQTVAMELIALATVGASLSYQFFRNGWLICVGVFVAIVCVVISPLDAGLITMLVHVLCAGIVLWLWSQSAQNKPAAKALGRS